MNVAACLDATRLGRLRAALAAEHRLHVALDWEHAHSILRREPVDVLVVDPIADRGTAAIVPIDALHEAFPSVPVVMYTALVPAAYAAIADLGRRGFDTLVVHDVDDSPAQLLRVLGRQPGVARSAELLARLEPALRGLPADVAAAITRVVHTPAAFEGVADLASAAKVSRRTIYRECERAQLASPRELIAAARALRAYALLRETPLGIEDVAAALRFSSPHHLTKTMRWACGLTTARARDRMPPTEFLDALVARLRPTASSS